VLREKTINAPSTDGPWNSRYQANLFRSGVDYNFPNLTINGIVPGVEAHIFELHGTVRGFAKLISVESRLFFRGSIQGLQIIHDNPSVQKEIVLEKKHVYIPFYDADYHIKIACIFSNKGWLHAHLGNFHRGSVPKRSEGIFILPMHPFAVKK
jgi:hypothetical protein